MQPLDCSSESFDLISCKFRCGSPRDRTSGLHVDVLTHGRTASRAGVIDRDTGLTAARDPERTLSDGRRATPQLPAAFPSSIKPHTGLYGSFDWPARRRSLHRRTCA
jgi:hypothetical protein